MPDQFGGLEQLDGNKTLSDARTASPLQQSLHSRKVPALALALGGRERSEAMVP
jgi:hypothetical protein